MFSALMASYMASKWGIEALQQSLKYEFRITGQPIDTLMINPGTRLAYLRCCVSMEM